MKAEYIVPTPAEIEEMKHGDRETINRLYMANYAFITSCACGYLLKKVGVFVQSDIEELANEVYLRFSELDFDGRAKFTISLYDTFLFFHYGGKKTYYRNYGRFPLLVSLDKPVMVANRSGESESGATLGELFCVPEYEEVDDITEMLFVICSKFLTQKEREIFYYQLFTGFTSAEIARELGKTRGAVLSQMCTLRKSLVFHYREILFRLWKSGSVFALYYLKNQISPPDYDSVLEFYLRRRERDRSRLRELRKNSEWRESKNAKLREWRSRKKS